MLFNSLAFALFLPVVFLLYWFVFNKSVRRQNILVLLASYYFYGSWDWRFLSLIFLSSILDYIVGHKIYGTEDEKKRKRLLIVSIVFNLGMLGFFKYYNFFVDSFIALFSTVGIQLTKGTLEVLLPVGISFYTFQTLSYTIDIYRRKLAPTKDPVAFFAFVAFFPQLVAGPIERAIDLLPQFHRERKFHYKEATAGLRKILWGLFKKVVVADNIAKYVAIVYSSPEDYYGLSVILAMVLFTIQVYCDFSGYSDTAIGVAQLFNFKLAVNFRTPLQSQSMKEFWSRWHITLSSWFRDYLYIPLGGNRGTKARWFSNLFITFLISGLWHGASWAFVIWGALNGIYLIIEVLLKSFFEKFNKVIGLVKIPRLLTVIKVFITFNLFAFSLLIFRAESGEDALVLIQHLLVNIGEQISSFSNFKEVIKEIFVNSRSLIYLMMSIGILAIVDFTIGKRSIEDFIYKIPRPLRFGIYFFLIGWFLIFGAFENPQEFVYFQF